MSAEHDGTEPDSSDPGAWMVENVVRGLPTVPVAVTPLGSGAATLVRTSVQVWNGGAVGTPVLVPYSFAVQDSSYYVKEPGVLFSGFFLPGKSEAFDQAQRASVLQALVMWEQVSGLTFIEVPDAPGVWSGGIRFQLENLPSGTLGQTSSFLPSGAAVTLARNLYANDAMQPGSDAFWALLHEIGHAVGLKHPFDEPPVLEAIHDNNINTVMSYRDLGNHSQLGPYDIAAAQHRYGTQAAEETLAVRWSRGPGGALVSTGNDAANTITGLDIRDVVRGGGGNDTIHGQGGEDDIVPGNGADTAFGGPGFDTVWAEAPRRHAALVDQAGVKVLSLPNGVDRLTEVETVRFRDGQVSFHADLAPGQVFRLYAAVLGRAPDPIGSGQWVQALETSATSLGAVAAGFAGSAEFAARYGAPDDAGFVTLLYANVLGRAPDAAGLDHWLNAVATGGTGRAGALLGFSESAEHKQRTAAVYHNGLWAPDPEAVDVLRAYAAVLDRLPDAAGLASGTAAREAGLGQADMVVRFIASAEFQGRFGASPARPAKPSTKPSAPASAKRSTLGRR